MTLSARSPIPAVALSLCLIAGHAGAQTLEGVLTEARLVKSLSAEHGVLSLAPSAQNLQIGDRLEFIPGYSDFTCVLHDRFYGIRQGRLEEIIPLTGRGRLQ